MRDTAAIIAAFLALAGVLVVVATVVPSLLPTSVIAAPWRRRVRLTLAGATAWSIVFLATAVAVMPPAGGEDPAAATTTAGADPAPSTTTPEPTTTAAPTTTTSAPTSTTATTTAPTTTVRSSTTAPAGIPGAATGTVVSVTDGDTLDVRVDGRTETVRLIGINAPESGECYSAEAEDALAALVAVGTVQLTTDVSERDRFGRLLRYLWAADGLFVNEALVEAGAALAREYPPDTALAGRLAAAEQRARSAERGLWAPDACGAPSAAPLAFSGAVFDAPGDDLDPITGERVAITNAGTSLVDLTGWSLADESASHRYAFPTGFTLAAGATVTVYTACGTDTAGFLYWCEQGSAVWNNDGDTAFLRDPNGNIVDTTTGSGLAPTAPPVAPVVTPSTTGGGSTGGCDPSYPDVCIPPYPPDLDCGQIDERRFRVDGNDPHGFDGDGDGIGCEG